MRCCRVSNPPFDKGKVALFVLMGVSLRDLGWGNSCRWYILCLKLVLIYTGNFLAGLGEHRDGYVHVVVSAVVFVPEPSVRC